MTGLSTALLNVLDMTSRFDTISRLGLPARQ